MKRILPYLDDILLFISLVCFVTASYLVNAILGTYILGVAFLVAAFFAGEWLKSPIVQQIISKFQKRK